MDAQTLILFLLKATVLLMVGTAVAVALRRSSAGTRHLVWLATLAAILVLPALLRFAPVRLEVLPGLPERAAAASPAGPALPLAAPAVSESAVDAFSAPSQRPPASVPGEASARRFSLPSPGRMLLAIWMGVALALLGWLAAGGLAVRRIVRSSRPLDGPGWAAALCEVADRLGLEALPRLVASDRIEMPFACGTWRATVVLPASAEQWGDDRRRLVLLHELAHVRRRDLLGHTAGRLACAAYWFHPLVWTAAKRLRIESERACDDLVLATGARASDYADHLLDIVAAARQGSAPAPALPMARRREFEGRMLAILDPAVRRGTPGRVQSVGLLAGLAALFLSVAATAPSPVAAAVAPPPSAPDEATLLSAAVAEPVARQQARPPAARAKAEAKEAEPAIVYADEDEPAKEDAEDSDEPREIDEGKRATLIRVLRNDPDASVRRSAAWALAHTQAPGAAEALATALRGDADAEVREMAAWALGHASGEAGALATALKEDKSPEVRRTAVWALAHGRRVDASVLASALGDSSSAVREVAIWAIGQQRLGQAPAGVTSALKDSDAEIRLVAAWALGQIRDPATVPALRAAFKEEKDEEIRRALFRALLLLDRSNELIEQALASKDVELRTRAVQMLAGHRGHAMVWPWPRPEPRPFP